MKCPKCSYLGFETGDRCKNCGYDFSLMMKTPTQEDVALDWTLQLSEVDSTTAPGWLDSIDLHAPDFADTDVALKIAEPQPTAVPTPVVAPAATFRGPEPVASRVAPALLPETKLPLFSPGSEDDGDEPLIQLRAAPRPPLAVRKTPEVPRLRSITRPMPRVSHEPEPILAFHDAAASASEPVAPASRAVSLRAGEVGRPRPRLMAAVVDHMILGGIDLAVVYLTLRMAGLVMGDWASLPLVPLAAFLLLVKLSYFTAFTALGGQTIGKMASHLRVVTDDGAPVGGVGAIQRTAAGAVSTLALGLGFLPALIGSDRRALHDRLTGTRVVSQHSA